MEEKDSFVLSKDLDFSVNLISHKPKDSLDSELGRLSEAIFQKRLELENPKPEDSNFFTLNDSQNNWKDTSQEFEKLQMKIEDLLSILSFRLCDTQSFFEKKDSVFCQPRPSLFDFSNIFENSVVNYVECSLMELYKLLADVKKIILNAETKIKHNGRLSLGNLKLDIKVVMDDSPIAEKDVIQKNMSKVSVFKKKSNKTEEKTEGFFYSNILNLFSDIEKDITKAYNDMKFPKIFETNFTIQKQTTEKENPKRCIMMELEYSMVKKLKKVEKAKIDELEWQCLQTKAKKSYFFNKSKKMTAKEDELRKFSKKISEQTVQNAKDSEEIEKKIDLLECKKLEIEKEFNAKTELITMVLQEIEDSKTEETESFTKINKSASSKVYKNTSVQEIPLEKQIKEFEKIFKELEVEFKTSKMQESLESIETTFTRAKSYLSNLQSLEVLRKTKRNSSALRTTINKIEKYWENFSDPTTSKTGSSNNTDSNHFKANNLPHLLLKPDLMISQFKSLKNKTPKLDFLSLNSPSRRQSLSRIESPQNNDLEIKKYLRKKDEILREREDQLKIEENKLQSLWKNVPEGNEMIPVIQTEILEYRKLRKEFYAKIESLEREKSELRERTKMFLLKEKEFREKEQKMNRKIQDFKENKQKIEEKLTWLKSKLINSKFL